MKARTSSILITGVSSGIGYELMMRLSGEGKYRIIGISKTEVKAPDNCEIIKMDLSDEASILAGCNRINNLADDIKYVVHNAGVYSTGLLMSTSYTHMLDIYKINVLPVILITQKLLSQLRHNRARIIVIGSDAGFISLPYSIPYNMSKFALDSLVEGLAHELCDYDISISMLIAGNIRTELLKKAVERELSEHKEIPAILREQYEKVMDNIRGGSINGMSPDTVVDVLTRWIADKTPQRYYSIMSDNERDYLLTGILEKFIMLNKSMYIPWDLNRISTELDFVTEM